VFATLGVLLLVVIVFPQVASRAIHALAVWAGRRSRRIESKLEKLLVGIDEAHAAVAKFNTPRGWLSLFWATLLSGPSHANKLLAGYVALRVIGIEAHFVDVLLVQTLITFLLYFAPTPGASGRSVAGYALIGLLVGVVPVALGMLWLPALRQAGARFIASGPEILLFSKSGFEKSLVDQAAGREDVRLVDLDQLEQGLG